MAKHKCLSCEVVIDFEPVYCCSGRECGCKGLPIDPPLCGDCERELFKMAKINREEYEVLKEAQEEGYKWIARNYNGALIIYTSKPMKNPNLYWDGFGKRMDDRLFKFIQWEDEEPHNIAELIEEYLYDNQPKLFIDGQEQSFEIIEESEETEVKDLEWVKSKLKKDHKDGEVAKSQIKDGEKIDGIDLNSYWRGRQTANYIARCYLEDLDEPETLSEDWIQEHSYNVHLLGTPDVTTVAVPREDLQNLLVPKQELPVIPKEVGERIEREINRCSLYQSLNYAFNYEGVGEDERRIDEWVIENTEEYARAWLNGFTVLKYPILLAKIKGWEQFVDFVGAIYWGTDDDTDRLTFVDRDQALAVTKKDWEQLGITEKNADFINHYE